MDFERRIERDANANMNDRERGTQNRQFEIGRELDSTEALFPRDPPPLYRSDYSGPVEVTTFEFGGTSIRLARPADPDRLLDNPRVNAWNRRDDYMPYWAYLWPSAILLAEWVACSPLVERTDKGAIALQSLEIGCGLGLPGLVGVARGLRVQFTDHDAAPLEFVSRSAAENGFECSRYSVRHLDWRTLPDERFAIVLGADLLYELRLVPLVAGLLSRLLAPEGIGVIASPNRAAALGFPAALADVGLTSQEKSVTARSPGGQTIEGTIFQVRRRNSIFTTGIMPASSRPI
jgi:predicted nicotinamide N-methyase